MSYCALTGNSLSESGAVQRLFRPASSPLARRLGVKWDTAWLIKQKLTEAMRQRNKRYKLKGEVQFDDAYLGGEKPGKRRR